MNWHAIKDLSNWKLAKAIDGRLSEPVVDFTLVFKNGRFGISSADDGLLGRYNVDDDGAVFVNWENGEEDVYWMYAKGDYLYSIEFSVDDSGELAADQKAHKFRRVSK